MAAFDKREGFASTNNIAGLFMDGGHDAGKAWNDMGHTLSMELHLAWHLDRAYNRSWPGVVDFNTELREFFRGERNKPCVAPRCRTVLVKSCPARLLTGK